MSKLTDVFSKMRDGVKCEYCGIGLSVDKYKSHINSDDCKSVLWKVSYELKKMI
jgi:hypothetical protein